MKRKSATPAVELAGLSPGSAVYRGPPRQQEVGIRALRYWPEGYEEFEDLDLAGVAELPAPGRHCWVDLDGIHDVETIRGVCATFGVHPLALEEVLDPDARVKIDDFDESLFVVAKMIMPARDPGPAGPHYTVEQVSLVLTADTLVSFQEREGDVFEPLRKRIRRGNGRVRTMPSDYLLHGVLDALVDGYFVVLEHLDDSLLGLEERVVGPSHDDVVKEIHDRKVELLTLRRLIWPLREVTAELARAEGGLLTAASDPFFRDLHDNVLQVIDQLDAQRDRLSSLLELHLALTSHRTNDVMRVLTVVSTLFIPLTFIVGVYGMNFHHMPELAWSWGYPAVWAVMAGTFVGMAWWLKRLGYL